MNSFHLARRKLATFSATIRACSNWPAVARARLDATAKLDALRFRNGLQLQPMQPLQRTWGEIFEPAIADVYGIRDRAHDLIIDVGANIGAFACLAGHLHTRAQVHAFEPSKNHADLLENNVARNRLTNVILYRVPVTKDGREVIFSELGDGGASGIILHENGKAVPMQSLSLDCVNFSGAGSVFIKLDCEGAEGEIIEWVCTNLAKLPARILLACEYHHWCPIPSTRLLTMLRDHGFQAEPRTLFDEAYLFAMHESPGKLS